jgi:hypothetical protein
MRLDTNFLGGSLTELFAKYDEVILGWLLGVLSAPLVMYCTAFVERRRFKTVLNAELREVRFRLAASTYSLRLHLGQMNRASLEWISAELSAYSAIPERDRLIASLQPLLGLTDAQLAGLANQPRNPLGSKALPRIVIPYLSARLESIGLLCSSEQKELVNLLHYVEVINVKAEELADWNQRTFDVTNNENHVRAAGNADTSIQAIITAAELATASIKNYFS